MLVTRCQRYANTRALRSIHEALRQLVQKSTRILKRTIRRDEILTAPKSLTIPGWIELANQRLLLARD
ncbi:MAG: hypothetical protein DMF75_07380 [Acidobacteria bacterium]|nr:MAG: hypothetical protein DMF75_07380 [Acidobacteriota bacterium]